MSESALHAEVADLYARYAWAIAEGPLTDWGALFLEHGDYRLVTRENVERGWPLALIFCESRAAIEDRIHAIEHSMMTLPRRARQLISGWRIVSIGDEIQVKAHFAVYETLAGQMTTLFAAGLHDDILARDGDGSLLFKSKVSIVDGDVIPNSLVLPI